MQGKIIKGIAGFYYVHVEDAGIYECKAKGAFRKQKIKPLVGDNVEIDILNENDFLGNIVDILPRKNELIRPAVSNIDQAIVIFAAKDPEPNLNLLDRFLLMMEKQGVETIICFNKTDLVTEDDKKRLADIYKKCGYKVMFTSTKTDLGLREFMECIKGKTTVFAGPSGVGKSSTLNMIKPDAHMEIGDISQKIKRGKHTTRHSEIFYIGENTYIMDTPGFSSLFIEWFDKDELKNYFIEFEQYEDYCRFNGCIHVNEPNCAVKEALSEGKISQSRYDNYLQMYEELKNKKKY